MPAPATPFARWIHSRVTPVRTLSFLVVILALTVLAQWDRNLSLKQELFLSRNDVVRYTTAAVPTAVPTPQLEGNALFKQAGTILPDDHIRGKASAQVLLIEYSDYECPFCQTFHPELKRALEEYGDKVAWVFRHLPLSIHPNAKQKAETGECVYQQGGEDLFWKYTDREYGRITSDSIDKQLADAVTALGLQVTPLLECMQKDAPKARVQRDIAMAATIGAGATPSTVLIDANNPEKSQLIVGSLVYDQLKQAIDAALQ